MGHQSTVRPAAEAGEANSARRVFCDQAVFTSVRHGAGEGYRLVAASPGVRAEEKIEIIRRSPSHDSLCEGDPMPVGLSSYRLGSGRQGVAWCGHAGCEHTARGGQRVYTHMVLLDRAAYRRFNGDPVLVHSALASVLGGQGLLLKPAPRLEPLPLPVPPPMGVEQQAAPLPPASLNVSKWIWAVAGELLAGRRLILVGASESFRLLEWALLCLPLAMREHVDASVGLKFSPGRRMRLVLLPQEGASIRRLLAGEDIALWHANGSPPPVAPFFKTWLRFLRRFWSEGRLAELVHLTSHVCADVPPDELARVAAICEETEDLAEVPARLADALGPA